ncbi:MAG: hypothetical protein ACKO3G_06320 [Planctomycetaceae bacterium]
MTRGSTSIDRAFDSSSRSQDEGWASPTLVAFRFVFVWFVIEFHTALLQVVPLLEPLAHWIDVAKRPFYTVIARTLLGVRIESFSDSSGDTTYDWVRVAVNLALAAAGCGLWTAFDRRSRAYPRLADGLRTAIRFTLAATMFTYGLAKVFPLQFQLLEVPTLLRTYGESSPMGLLWVFMSASRPYAIFAGAMELVGGLLLCFRRTQLAGALWTAGVMTNVFFLNLCYDVPVKLFSLQLVLLAILVAAPDVPRLLRMFVWNLPVPPADLCGPYRGARSRRALAGLKIAWLASTLALVSFGSARTAALLSPPEAAGTRAGTWEIGEWRRGQDASPPTDDGRRWRFVTLVDRAEGKALMVRSGDGSGKTWRFEDHGDALDLFEPPAADPAAPGTAAAAGRLVLALDDAETLRCSGEIGGERIEFVGRRRGRADFLLTSRGFHLVSEAPFNR